MAKQDVLNAINSTIVQNDIKAITAQSLNNVLTMMVENAGEGGGSGDGAMRVMVPDMITGLQEEFIAAGEFSPSVWEQMKIEVTESGIDVSLYDDVFNTCFAHNAEVYQTLLGKLESHEGTYVILDQSLSGSVGYKILLDAMINSIGMGSVESSNMSMGQLAMCGVIDIKTSDLDDSIKEMIGLPEGVQIMIAPIYNEYMGGYSDTLMMSLLPDGSILFQGGGIEGSADYVYIPTKFGESPANDVVIPASKMSHNASLVSGRYMENIKFIEYVDEDGDGYSNTPRVTFSTFGSRGIDNSDYCIVEYWHGSKLYRSTIELDGSVNTIELSSLPVNTTTE